MTKEEEFAVLYQKHYRKLLWQAQRIVKEKHAAEDIAQEAFIELWNRLEVIAKPEYWLLTIITNKSINYLKVVRRETVYEFELLEATLDEIRNYEDPEVQVYYGYILEKVTKALYKKNKKWYTVINQLFFENKSQKEVADTIKVTVTDLREMLFRIRSWLREEFLEKNKYEEFVI